MSNQFILWSMLIIPWLTLFFMKKEDVKRFISVGLLSLVTSIIIIEAGISTGLWVIRETTFPLAVIPTYAYGIYAVSPMWILKFTYGRFWIYLITELLVNLSFVIILLPWIASRGIIVFNAPLISYFLANGLSILLYGYQMWQEDAIAPAVKKLFSPKLQQAAAKPVFEDKKDCDQG